MTRRGLLALVAALSSAAHAQQRSPADNELNRLRAAAQAECATLAELPRPPDEPVIRRARWLAGLEQPHHIVCPPDPGRALRIARRVAAQPGPEAREAHLLLADMFGRGIGVGMDRDKALEHRRFAALLAGAEAGAGAFASQAERDAYLVRPETIAFLRRHAVAPPHAATVPLARALLLRGGDGDADAAIAALTSAPRADEPPVRYLRAWAALQRDGDDEAAIVELSALAAHRNGTEARARLLEVAQRRLRQARNDTERAQSIELLAIAARWLEPRALNALNLAITAVNDGRPPAVLAGAQLEAVRDYMRQVVSDDDYPAEALRNEEEGRIALRGLIDPRGRLILVAPAGSDPSEALARAALRFYSRLPAQGLQVTRGEAASYLWVELPPIEFRIAN